MQKKNYQQKTKMRTKLKKTREIDVRRDHNAFRYSTMSTATYVVGFGLILDFLLWGLNDETEIYNKICMCMCVEQI